MESLSRRFKGISAFVCIFILHSGICSAEDLYVEVQTMKLRASPKAWAAPLGDVTYGDKVSVLERSAPWIKVKSGTLEGYLHETAVTTRRPLGTTKNAVAGQVSTADVVLAGKGFNDQIVAEWEKSNPEAKMGLVEAMEKRSKVSPQEILGFIKAGELNLEARQ